MTEKGLRLSTKPILQDIFWIGRNCHIITDVQYDHELDRLMALIKANCWLKGEQKEPDNPYTHNWPDNIIWEQCRKAMIDNKFKPCKEWEK